MAKSNDGKCLEIGKLQSIWSENKEKRAAKTSQLFWWEWILDGPKWHTRLGPSWSTSSKIGSCEIAYSAWWVSNGLKWHAWYVVTGYRSIELEESW